MNFVADCSIVMAWVLKDEATAATDAVLDALGRGAIAVVPASWRWEVGNVLLGAQRQRRATQTEVKAQLQQLDTLPIEIDENALSHAWDSTYRLALKHNLTSFDAAYLELAARRGLPLASLDADLRRAAKSEHVRLLPEKVSRK